MLESIFYFCFFDKINRNIQLFSQIVSNKIEKLCFQMFMYSDAEESNFRSCKSK